MKNKKYKIFDLLHDEESEVKALAELLYKYTKTKVAFLDIVSVEKKQNKEYNVDWFASNKSALESYYNIIENYFKTEDDSKTSLLFLSGESAEMGKVRNKYFPVNINANCECEIDFSFKLKAKFELKEIKSIPKIEEETHFVKWTNEVLSQMCISYATFTKIEFSIQDRPFIAAIWIGYNEGSSNFQRDFVYNKIVENFLWSYSTKTIAGNLISDINLQATRAAISQVMARNTSHNIGAHVMNKLIVDLSELDFSGFKNYNTKIKLYEGVSDENKILLNQIAIFNNYVKCRMDYLADISFGTPLMQTNKYVHEDLFNKLDEVRLLLEYISGLDDFKFEIQFKKNGIGFKKNNVNKVEEDLLVAIPNDILGTQAFYNILENIIRNSAKHSDKSKVDGNVVFTVNFIDDIRGVSGYCENEKCKKENCIKAHKTEIENTLNEFIAVEVYDNIPVEGTIRALSDDEKKEYKRMMGEKEPAFNAYIDYLVFCQNEKLNKDILDQNKLRSYSLGLVEMNASAAYMRKRPVEYINHKSYDILYDESWSRDTEENDGNQDRRGTNCRHFLKAFKKTEGVEHYLGYRFFLHRPAVVLVVTDELKQDKDRKDKLRKEGIWVIGREEFINKLNEGKVYPHEFLVIDSNINIGRVGDIEILVYNKTSLPIRALHQIDDLPSLLNKTSSEIEERCWQIWEEKLKIKYEFSNYSFDYLPKKDKIAMITDHLKPKENESVLKTWESYKERCYYIEPTSNLAQKTWPNYNGNFDTYFDLLKNSIILKAKHAESILTNIIVIDERVQSGSLQKPLGILQQEVFNMMGIFIPVDINLAHSTIDKEGIIEYIEKHVPNCEFLLLHYSILERIFNEERDRLKAINDFLIKQASRINVVITSGRGIPDRLPREVRFINLSSVLMAFNDVRGKYLINYLLNSARKTSIL